jgi:hypothetical protein
MIWSTEIYPLFNVRWGVDWLQKPLGVKIISGKGGESTELEEGMPEIGHAIDNVR